jgi:hypothetical protein
VTPQTLLPGALIPKFAHELPVAGQISVVNATGTDWVAPLPPIPSDTGFFITMSEFQAQILPTTFINPATNLPYGPSWVWGYLTTVTIRLVRPSYLGPVVVAKRNVETTPTFINALPFGVNSLVQQLLPIDQTLDWADPLNTNCAGQPPIGNCAGIYTGPQPAVPHIHGGEVALYDGGPDAWYLPVNTVTGVVGIGSPAAAGTGQAQFIYPTRAQAGTIWFHDTHWASRA